MSVEGCSGTRRYLPWIRLLRGYYFRNTGCRWLLNGYVAFLLGSSRYSLFHCGLFRRHGFLEQSFHGADRWGEVSKSCKIGLIVEPAPAGVCAVFLWWSRVHCSFEAPMVSCKVAGLVDLHCKAARVDLSTLKYCLNVNEASMALLTAKGLWIA